jgi:hypothetical protein
MRASYKIKSKKPSTYKISAFNESGVKLIDNLNSREIMRFLKLSYNLATTHFERLNNGEVCKLKYNVGNQIKPVFIVLTKNKHIIPNYIKEYQIQNNNKLLINSTNSVNDLLNNIILKLDCNFNVVKTYVNQKMINIASDLKLPVGTVKAKLHKDRVIIEKQLTGQKVITTSLYRLIYLEDLNKINKLCHKNTSRLKSVIN